MRRESRRVGGTGRRRCSKVDWVPPGTWQWASGTWQFQGKHPYTLENLHKEEKELCSKVDWVPPGTRYLPPGKVSFVSNTVDNVRYHSNAYEHWKTFTRGRRRSCAARSTWSHLAPGKVSFVSNTVGNVRYHPSIYEYWKTFTRWRKSS